MKLGWVKMGCVKLGRGKLGWVGLGQVGLWSSRVVIKLDFGQIGLDTLTGNLAYHVNRGEQIYGSPNQV
jgi:hypothetical protein